MSRPEKRSESLEVRLGHSAKQAFMDACREKGLTASEVIRDYVETYPAHNRQGSWVPFKTMEFKPMHASILALISAFGLASSTSLVGTTAVVANPEPDAEEQFAELDLDQDGYFDIYDLRRIAGMNRDGGLGDEMVEEITQDVRSALAEHGPVIIEGMTSDEFIERTLHNAGQEAKSSLDSVFADVDANDDRRVSFQEFSVYHDENNLQ